MSVCIAGGDVKWGSKISRYFELFSPVFCYGIRCWW